MKTDYAIVATVAAITSAAVVLLALQLSLGTVLVVALGWLSGTTAGYTAWQRIHTTNGKTTAPLG